MALSAKSGYFESLDEQGKQRYREKLEAVGLSLQDDPYAPGKNDRFSSDMTHFPRIEYGCIFAYFITRPGTRTLHRNSCSLGKQLEAYNYFQSGHMRTVVFMELGHGKAKCIVLKAKVNPSQRTPDNAYARCVDNC